MGDTLYASGSFDWRGGSFATEYVAIVLGHPDDGDQPVLTLRDGTAKIYDLNPVSFFGSGSMAFAGGNAYFFTGPNGGFEDFAIFPETGEDPLDGFLLADNAGTLTAGVGQDWTRHYAVAVPPRKARFAVPHVKLGSIAPGKSQYLDAHQVEVLRVDQSLPTPFESARAIRVTVRPKRLNLAAGSLTVTDLIPGRTYTASAYEGTTQQRSSYQFVPTVSTWTLVFPDLVPPTRILVEEGTTLGDYFDGNSGPDYLWEQGGTPGEARSYYYPDRSARHYILVRTLQENVALGMVVEDPVYATFPSPSSTS